MPSVSDLRPAVSPLLITALLLAARRHLCRLRLPHPTARQIFEATGATHSRAYELKDALLALLPTLERPVGRPPAEPVEGRPPLPHPLRVRERTRGEALPR